MPIKKSRAKKQKREQQEINLFWYINTSSTRNQYHLLWKLTKCGLIGKYVWIPVVSFFMAQEDGGLGALRPQLGVP